MRNAASRSHESHEAHVAPVPLTSHAFSVVLVRVD